MAVSDYNTTPASNTSISGTNIAEGCSPSGINDAIRQMMADIKTFANGLDIGSDVQAYSANLASLSGLTFAANKGLYTTGANTAALFDLTAAGRALLDDADAAAQRATLGIGDLAVFDAVDFYKDDATWAAGTDTGPAMISPAQLETKLRAGYDSGETAINTSAEMTFSHGLGEIPLIFTVGLICTTANLGYSVGDYVPLYPNSSTSGDTETNPIWATDTDIGIRFFSTPKISHKTSTASVQNINGGSWSVVVRARK